MYIKLQNFEQPRNRSTSHCWDIFYLRFSECQMQQFKWKQHIHICGFCFFFLNRLHCRCYIKYVCQTQKTEYSPVSPSLKSCSLKYMYSKLTDIHKEEHKEPEWTVTPERGEKKNVMQPGNKWVLTNHYTMKKKSTFSRWKVFWIIDDDFKYW